jgi:aminomethyltransferase
MDTVDPLRNTPLDDRHRELGATMTAFGGWDMPLDYGSVVAEHRAVRESCGVFDLSHLGTVRVTGPDAAAVLQHAFSNDVASLAEGECQYTLCLNDDAGIVDDLIVSRFAWGYWAVPNAANAAEVIAMMRASAEDKDCDIIDVKDDTACLAVQGPRAAEVLTGAGIDGVDLDYMHGRTLAIAPPSGEVEGDSRMPESEGLLTRTGYTGEIGFEVLLPIDRAPDMWDRITEAGAAPAGLGCRDTLRLEMGYALHGQDISVDTTPVEARLGWAVKAGTGFRGENAYVAAKEAGPSRRLWGLRASGRGIPRAGQRVMVDGRQVGSTTSGTFSPTCKIGVAMAYLDAYLDAGAEVQIDVRGRPLAAEIMRPPFVDADPKG